MIADLTLRWVVTALFALSSVEWLRALASSDRTPLTLIRQILHLVMAVAMIVMAWPWGADLPTVLPAVFFLAAAAWFVVAAVIEPNHWALNIYHFAMMLAMSWMYAVMNGGILPGQSSGGEMAGHQHHGAAMAMPDMGADAAAAPPYIGMLNWLAAVGFAVAAAWWVLRYFHRRRRQQDPVPAVRAGECAQAMMAAGMAIMFAVML